MALVISSPFVAVLFITDDETFDELQLVTGDTDDADDDPPLLDDERGDEDDSSLGGDLA